jgi:hypothetical protein
MIMNYVSLVYILMLSPVDTVLHFLNPLLRLSGSNLGPSLV